MTVDIKTAEGKRHYDGILLEQSYLTGTLGARDVEAMEALGSAPDVATFPSLNRWYNHVHGFPAEERLKLKLSAAQAAPAVPAKAAEKPADDDDFDLFGDVDPEEAKAVAMKAKASAKPKKVVINKSSLVIDIKPASAETDLDLIAGQIKNITVDGLTWGEAVTKIPIAYGLQKLRCSCVILDDLVNTNELVDTVECIGMNEEQKKLKRQIADGEIDEDDLEEDELGGLVQSAEIASFNKL